MIFLRNKIEQHLWNRLLALKFIGTSDGSIQPTPWVQPCDVVALAEAELRGKGVLASYDQEEKFVPMLLTRESIATSTLHRMSSEGILVTRERITWGNLDRVVAGRYGTDLEKARSCKESFRLALMESEQRDGSENIRDERIHVYHGHDVEFDEEPECQCLRRRIVQPEGVVPAPVPGKGPKGIPGSSSPSPGIGGRDPVPA